MSGADSSVAAGMPEVVVIGSVFLDSKQYVRTDDPAAPPDRVYRCHGGVGRNIAENLGTLGVPVALLALSDGDPADRDIRERLERAHVRWYARSVDRGIGRFSVTLDAEGAMISSSARLPALEHLDPAFVATCGCPFDRAKCLIVEAGMSRSLLDFLIREMHDRRIPIVGVMTGGAFTEDRSDLLARLHGLTLNRPEAARLLQQPIETMDDAAVAVERLRRLGIANVGLTLGAAGVLIAAEGERTAFHPAPAVTSLDATGAGDAFTAGLVSVMIRTGSFSKGAALGMTLAAAVVRTLDNTIGEAAGARVTDAKRVSGDSLS